MNPTPRKILMIAAAFPPTGGPGVQRPSKFAKYLPLFGWHPTVWTMERMEGLPQDPSLLEELPAELTRVFPRGGRCAAALESCRSPTAQEQWHTVTRNESWNDALVPWLIDDHGAWVSASVAPLAQLSRSEEFDAIYSTFSPPSNHWLALRLKERTALPWVADFRDLWVDDCRYRERVAARAFAHRELQQRVLEEADAVVGVTESQMAILAAHVPEQREKFVTITNGYDPADFEHLATHSRLHSGRFILVHVGRFDSWRATTGLLAGLRRFAVMLGAQRKLFEFRMVGHASKETLARVTNTGVPHTYQPYVSHRDAVREMVSATALLLPLPMGVHADSIIAGKLFEYLASRRPILVVGPDGGECARIVEKHRAGLAVAPQEGDVEQALRTLFSDWHSDRSFAGCDVASLKPYSRIELTWKLVALLDRLIHSEPLTSVSAEFPVPESPRGLKSAAR